MPRVLIVDDQRTNLAVMSLFVRLIEGCEPHPHLDSREALREASETPFDLAIIDHNMPHLSGLELIRRLRELPHSREIPVIVASVEDDPKVIRTARSAGVEHFLTKPVERERLAALVRGALRLDEAPVSRVLRAVKA